MKYLPYKVRYSFSCYSVYRALIREHYVSRYVPMYLIN